MAYLPSYIYHILKQKKEVRMPTAMILRIAPILVLIVWLPSKLKNTGGGAPKMSIFSTIFPHFV
jgi:hypothetical protein